MTNVSPLQCVLHQDATSSPSTITTTLTPRSSLENNTPLRPRSPPALILRSPPSPPSPTCIITAPSVFPCQRAPMSKPNTTDQQLDMQIVSRYKLCAACQLHTWALGWLSVTCVRVPLHLRRATLMTGCRVSPPPQLFCMPLQLQPLSQPLTTSPAPTTRHPP